MKKRIYLIQAFYFIIFFIITTSFFSCDSKEEKKEEKVYESIEPKRIIKDKILIVLGKDYSKRKNILKYLENEYGINNENAPVQVITYEDMTARTKLPRLKIIPEKIKEFKATIVISIGIPEGGAYYLINELEKNKDLVIISLLPMDDILALEAGSDLVVDFETPTDIMSDEKDFNISDDDVMLLLTSAVFTGEYFHAKNKNLERAPIEEFSEAFFNTQKVLDKKVFDGNYSIKTYIDPETKIPSLKYLLIYENKKN